jgi:hypothetical protein
MCIAGVGQFGVLTAIVDWVRSDPAEECAPGKHFLSKPPERISLHVGGLGNGEFQDCLNADLKIGDRATVEAVEAETPDQPVARRRETTAKEAHFAARHDRGNICGECAAVVIKTLEQR